MGRAANRVTGSCVTVLLWLALLSLPADPVSAQDLEPRRWSHLPNDLNVFGAGLGLTDGDISFDPVLLIEDATFELGTLGTSYVRTFDWLGKSARLDVSVPYGYGRWEGLVDGVDTSVRRHGAMDPRVRLSMNLWGAPPLSGEAFVNYRQQHPVTTTVGVAVQVILPLGEYRGDRLINLGGNRTVIRPQLGVLHQRGPWQFEVTGSVSFYEDNDEFYGGTVLEQDPLGFLQGHIIRSFAKGRWASASAGYSHGGEGTVNGVAKNNSERTRFWALSAGMPLTRQQSVKLTWVNATTNIPLGADSDSLVLGWSVSW